MEAHFVHDNYDGLLSLQGANHAPGEILAGFRHIYAGIGGETAEPGLDRVEYSQEGQVEGDRVEGAGFRLGDAKAEGGADFALLRGSGTCF